VTAEPAGPQAQGATAVRGEGEVVWPDILRDAENGVLKPVYDARGCEFDLAHAPIPAYELVDWRRYDKVAVQASRGCPWRCSFCAGSHLMTRKHKQKPAAKVLAEIDRIGELWPRPFVVFADDNAFVNRNYCGDCYRNFANARSGGPRKPMCRCTKTANCWTSCATPAASSLA
jgi:radical SAM superfamily enzyme YgiQ (UPF0313 family)